jgi:amino acid transporter
MDVIIYGAALFLEFVSLIILRIKSPEANRPFKIPLNITGLVIMICLPIGVYFIALAGAILDSGNSWQPVLLAIGILATAEIFWRFIVWRNPGLRKK